MSNSDSARSGPDKHSGEVTILVPRRFRHESGLVRELEREFPRLKVSIQPSEIESPKVSPILSLTNDPKAVAEFDELSEFVLSKVQTVIDKFTALYLPRQK